MLGKQFSMYFSLHIRLTIMNNMVYQKQLCCETLAILCRNLVEDGLYQSLTLLLCFIIIKMAKQGSRFIQYTVNTKLLNSLRPTRGSYAVLQSGMIPTRRGTPAARENAFLIPAASINPYSKLGVVNILLPLFQPPKLSAEDNYSLSLYFFL